MSTEIEPFVEVDIEPSRNHTEDDTSVLGLTSAQRKSLGLNDDTYEAIYDVFSSLDEDGSGTIDSSELGTAIKTMGVDVSDNEISDLMKQMDSDGNGTIDFFEFTKMISDKMHVYDPEKELRAAFKVFDKDGDGKISVDELKIVVESLGEKMSKEDLESMLLEADDNNDGYLDYAEFVKIWIGDETPESDRGKENDEDEAKDEESTETVLKES